MNNVDITRVRFEYHPEKGEIYTHAFYVPGLGYYGGLRPDLAQHIVMCVNRVLDAANFEKDTHDPLTPPELEEFEEDFRRRLREEDFKEYPAAGEHDA